MCIVSSPKNKEHCRPPRPQAIFFVLNIMSRLQWNSKPKRPKWIHDLIFYSLPQKNSSAYKRNFSCVKEGSVFRWCQGSSFIRAEPPKLSRKHPTQLLKQYSHKRAIITSSLEVRNPKVPLWKLIWILPRILKTLTYSSDIFLSFFMIKTIIIHMSKVKYTRNQQSVHWPFSTKHMTLKRLRVDVYIIETKPRGKFENWSIPSDRQPQLSLYTDSSEVNNAEAVTLCNGIRDCCTPDNSTGSLKHQHYNASKKQAYITTYLITQRNSPKIV